MSAALQLPMVWGTVGLRKAWPVRSRAELQSEVAGPAGQSAETSTQTLPDISLAFYRKHTQSLLRRYLYASMQVGRAPSILGEPVSRGWASSRPIRTFEDAVIFVLDVERCIERLGVLDRHLLSRIVLQEYTQAETAALLGMSARAVSYKFPQALDRLTEKLLQSGLLVVPND